MSTKDIIVLVAACQKEIINNNHKYKIEVHQAAVNGSMSRHPLSKKTRFEVFKRDAFTCQYCGRKAPDILLEVDHINPVAKQGTNDILNLITSCHDCNSGKSDRLLSDNTVLEKKHKQLAELQERKEQIDMMFEWQKGLLQLDDHVLSQLCEFWGELVPPFILSESGKRSLAKLLKKYDMSEVMRSMQTSVTQYVEYKDDAPTSESVEKSWEYVSRICAVNKQKQAKPYLTELYYVRGILRKRLSYVNERVAIQLLEQAYQLSVDIESLKDHAKEVTSWTHWRNDIESFIATRVKDINTDKTKVDTVSNEESENPFSFEDDTEDVVFVKSDNQAQQEIAQFEDISQHDVPQENMQEVEQKATWKPFQRMKDAKSRSKRKRRG